CVAHHQYSITFVEYSKNDCGPHNHWNMLNFIGHDSMMVDNLMNGIDLWINMQWAPQPLMINLIKI
ncbi:hypothetical protein DVA76_17680, partial [Acinetobacter baumannii]